MHHDPAASHKCDVRTRVRAARAGMSAAAKEAATAQLTRHLIALVAAHSAQVITCYLPLPTEPDTRPFLAWAWQQGIRVLLPVCRADMLLDWVAAANTPAVAPGRHGILEPVGARLKPQHAQGADLLLVPGCAVAADGTRLGWGAGYFDRTLSLLSPCPPVFTVLYSSEIYATLPRETHDMPVYGAVTDSGISRFATPLSTEDPAPAGLDATPGRG